MVHPDHNVRLFWEQFHRHPITKAIAIALIAVLVVVFTGKEFSLSRAIDDLNYDSAPAEARKPAKPAEKLHAAVVELQELLAAQAKNDLTDKQAKAATSARTEIAAQLKALDIQFASDRIKLYKLDAEDALKRLAVIERKTAQLKKQLNASLSNVPTDGARATIAADSASKILTALSPEKPQQPLSSDLSFGIKNAKPRSVSLSAGITPAYNAPTSGEDPSPLPRDPQPEDLEETPETRVTPAIEQLATTLDHDPVKIYEYVRNNIRFEPYYGIRKGADQTLAEKAGSDADQASLLIALMRESGIHARFIQGVAELPAEKAANWLGVNTAAGEWLDAVPEILWSGGIPTNTTRVAGQLTKVRFNHIWAEAYVSQEAYRGVDEGSSQKSWSPLDASIKENVFKQPQADFRQLLEPAVTSWAEGFVDGSQTVSDDGIIAPPPAQTAQQTQALLAEAEDVLEDHGIDDDSTLSDVIGSRDIKQTKSALLPNQTPFKALTVDGELLTVPENLNASVSFAVDGSDPLSVPDPEQGDQDGFSFTAKTLDLANKRITVSYVPATESDAEIVDAYHGLLNAPSYAATLIPVLRVDGEVVARGQAAVSTGNTQQFTIAYQMPGFIADVAQNPIYVGSLSVISLDLGGQSSGQLENRAGLHREVTQSNTASNVITDLRIGESLSLIGDLYFATNNSHDSIVSQGNTLHRTRQLSGAILATDLNISYIADIPVLASFSGFSIDVDADAQSVVSKTDRIDALESYIAASGAHASETEGWIFNTTIGGDAVSTARLFREAGAQHVPIIKLDKGNIADVGSLVDLSPSVVREIRAAVDSGAEYVLTVRQELTVGGWTGSGYIIKNGSASAYRISGGLSGGVSTEANDLNAASVKTAGISDAFVLCLLWINDLQDSLEGILSALAAMALLNAGINVVGPGLLGADMARYAPLINMTILTISIYILIQAVLDSDKCTPGSGVGGRN